MIETDIPIKILRKRFLNARGQARYKGQLWQLTFDDYCILFAEDKKYLRSGINSDSYNLCRIDQNGPWSKNNCEIRTRGAHASTVMLEKNRAVRR
jgi:hypothetical protein